MNPDKILIVDDEADIGLILKLQLEDAGYVTDRARDGVEALELLARKEYALMLLDIKMPRMDGLQVLEKVQGERIDVAVVMMTAHGGKRNREERGRGVRCGKVELRRALPLVG